jgi:superoxide dismutase
MNDIRLTIDLLEAKNKQTLEQIKLPYARTALSPVMSSGTIDMHFGKLYKGYVERYNKGEGDSSFNEAGAFLHSIWFAQFRSPGTRQPHGVILSLSNAIIKILQNLNKHSKKKP